MTWTGAIDNGNIASASNWSTNTAPTAISDLIFSGPTGMNSVNLTQSITVNSITFNNAANNLVSNVGVRGRGTGESVLTLNGAVNVTNNAHARFFPTNNSTNQLYVDLANTVTFNIADTSTFNMTSNGTHISGAGGIIKIGEGTLRVGGSESGGSTTTYSGGFELKEGLVLINFHSSSEGTNGFGTGTLTLSGGTIGSTTATNKSIGNNITLNGTVNLTYSGSTANIVVVSNAGSSTTLAQNSALRVLHTTTWNQAIGGGSNGLEKLGAGTLVLNAANTYTGQTAVTEGTLVLNGSIAGNLAVASGATFTGSGTVAGDAVISGLHSPGNSPGIQHFGGDLTYTTGASVLWELNANTITQGSPTAVFDQVMVGGTLDFAGATLLSLSFNGAGSTVNWNDAFWQFSRSWTIYDAAAVSGFSNLSLAPTNWLDGSGNEFNSILGGWQFTLAQVGNDIQLHYAAIPEPSTYAAVLGALAAAIVTLRRRRRVAV